MSAQGHWNGWSRGHSNGNRAPPAPGQNGVSICPIAGTHRPCTQLLSCGQPNPLVLLFAPWSAPRCVFANACYGGMVAREFGMGNAEFFCNCFLPEVGERRLV